jgi:hypothetical protein
VSDEPIRLRQGVEPVHRAPSTLFEHYCQHRGCKEWGAFGFARGGKGESRWFCYEHRKDGGRYL